MISTGPYYTNFYTSPGLAPKSHPALKVGTLNQKGSEAKYSKTAS